MSKFYNEYMLAKETLRELLEEEGSYLGYDTKSQAIRDILICPLEHFDWTDIEHIKTAALNLKSLDKLVHLYKE